MNETMRQKIMTLCELGNSTTLYTRTLLYMYLNLRLHRQWYNQLVYDEQTKYTASIHIVLCPGTGGGEKRAWYMYTLLTHVFDIPQLQYTTVKLRFTMTSHLHGCFINNSKADSYKLPISVEAFIRCVGQPVS